MKNWTNRRLFVSLLCCLVCLGQTRCDLMSASDAMEKFLKPSYIEFALSVFEKVNMKHPKDNVVMSMPALMSGLTMLYEGAAGKTEQILQKTIQFPAKKHDLRVALSSIHEKLSTSVGSNNIYKRGTRFFVSQDVTITDLYADILKEYYPNSGIENLNFDMAEEAASHINSWVNARSNGSIPTIVEKDDITSDTELVITSVEYFKGKWQTSFNPKFTRTLPFHVNSAETVDIPIMFGKGKYQVKIQDGHTMLKLPYQDSTMSFLIVLPDEKKPFNDAGLQQLLMKSLTSFKGDKENLQECEVFLPKFTVEESINLTPVFKEMGELGALFNMPTNFTTMMDNKPVSITSALQKARVQVDEIGSTAAAVQAYMISRRMMPVEEDCRVKINRPFLFLIMEGDIPLPMFVGKVLRPKYTS